MLIKMLVTKLKSFVLFFVNIFRRALCCFRRRRRPSTDAEPLVNIVVTKNDGEQDGDMWNDWEFKNKKPSNVQEHIEYYRQQQAKQLKQQTEEELVEEEPVDLFGDMAPKITKQQKLLISNSDKSKGYSLEASNEASEFMGNELENWGENSGWEKDAWDTDELLRQKKKEERERRQWELQQKRLEKGNKPNALGSKIAT